MAPVSSAPQLLAMASASTQAMVVPAPSSPIAAANVAVPVQAAPVVAPVAAPVAAQTAAVVTPTMPVVAQAAPARAAVAPAARALETVSMPAPINALPAVLVAAASPALQPAAAVVVAPNANAVSLASETRFDLSVNNAPAAQVFLQLGNGTAYNMLVAPEVSGSLSVTLKNTTVPEAMDTLRELFGYEYRITGNRIFVYPNTVQTRLYRVNYLPGRRQGSSDIRVTSSAISLSGSGSGSNNNSNNNGGNSGSNGSNGSSNSQRADDSSHVRTTSDADFWREVQASLTALVGTQGGRNVVLNPAAGVVVIKATPSELRQVENYLKAVQLSIERQVMLEAKIVEVELSRDSQTGINWAGFGKLLGSKTSVTVGSAAPGATLQANGNLSVDGTTVTPGAALAASALGKGFYGLALQSTNFAALLNFLQTQGDVQVLSSPRIATLNNQKAVLKVGSDELYVTGITSNTTSTGNSTVSTPTVTLQPFFAGIALDVTPQIDDSGQVMLHIHPSISTVSEKQKNIDLGTLGNFRLPLAASTVNETDSIVRVRDGQIVAIGGLMKQVLQSDRSGLPGLSEAPVVGGLFRQTTNVMSKRELVIMLKPTIITDEGGWPDAGAIANMTAPAARP
ncbi:MAG: pilus (MSHA type) biogenesis protein MshL [Ideonella sp.]|nr:pilus (MSHA type) biogenesis protein MshL [Ideonella sp.]MBL0148364.1 pilus (MSHA type) biogenesis protein MshL [Ideonella sp.]